MILGITGTFGSGKTTVAGLFKKHTIGIVIDADKIARKKLEEKKSEITKEFGTTNRKRLAAIVFSNSKKLQKLNSIIHPLVKQEINQIRKSREKIIIIDAPLLIEARIRVDKLVVVKTKRNAIIKRLAEKYKKEDVLKRIKYQLSLKNKIKHADYVVDNNHSLKNTENQVKNICDKIKHGLI